MRYLWLISRIDNPGPDCIHAAVVVSESEIGALGVRVNPNPPWIVGDEDLFPAWGDVPDPPRVASRLGHADPHIPEGYVILYHNQISYRVYTIDKVCYTVIGYL